MEVVEDLGISAYKGDHLSTGALGELTQRIRGGDIPTDTVLVVEQLDRLSRQGHRIALRWMEDVCDLGIKIAVVQGDRIYDAERLRDNMLDTIEILMKAKLAHDESVHKGKRVGAAWRRKQEAAQRHVPVTAITSGWLRLREDRSGFDVIEDRADTVRRIFQLVAEGYGVHTVAKMLGQDGTPSWGRTGKGWPGTQIRRLINSPAVEGDFIPYWHSERRQQGERSVGYYGHRVVDADLVARARAGLLGRQGKGSGNYHNHSNLFSGLMRCAACGGNLTMLVGPRWKDGVRVRPGYVACQDARRGRGCKSSVMFRYQDFEEAALKAMLHLALDGGFFRRAEATLSASIALAEAESALPIWNS